MNITPTTALLRRLRLASTVRNIPCRQYCRDLLVAWLAGGRAIYAPIDRGSATDRFERFVPLSPKQTTDLRVLAAGAGIGYSDLALRVLDAGCPQEEEVGAALLGCVVEG